MLRFLLLLWLLPLSLTVAAQSVSCDNDSTLPRRSRCDSIAAPIMTYRPGLYGYDHWNSPLHTGLNAELSLSASIGLGNHSPSGVGFGREVSLTYVSPLGKQLAYTLGVNTAQMDWGGYHYNQAGVGGTLNYLLNDRMSVSLAGYKDLVGPNSYVAPGLKRDSYLGGALNMKFNESFSISVSIGTSTWKY